MTSFKCPRFYYCSISQFIGYFQHIFSSRDIFYVVFLSLFSFKQFKTHYFFLLLQFTIDLHGVDGRIHISLLLQFTVDLHEVASISRCFCSCVWGFALDSQTIYFYHTSLHSQKLQHCKVRDVFRTLSISLTWSVSG